jgi:hypothetical protein
MNLRYTTPANSYWMELQDAAQYAGVRYDDLVDAVTTRQVRASTTHPARPGDWMVRMSDVDQWAGQFTRRLASI